MRVRVPTAQGIYFAVPLFGIKMRTPKRLAVLGCAKMYVTCH